MIGLERSTGSRRLTWWSVVGVFLVPIVMAAGFLVATWDSTARWNKVQAAVVNLDEPVELSGQTVPLGRQLTGGLVSADGSNGDDQDSGDQQNFNWVVSDADDAQTGLTDGRYAAVVTIPEDFSANATSYSKNDGDKAEQATVDIQTSKVGGVTDSAVANAISSAAVGTMNDELSQQYLDNLYLGFNQTQQGMQKSADGAEQLADGAGQLSDGIGKSADGADQLSTGMTQLSDGTEQLATGLTQTDTGADQLATGVGDLHDGIKQTDAGVGKLDTGVGKLDSSMDDFTKGTKQNAAGVKKYTAGVNSYVEGVDPFADGVGEYADGVSSYVDGVGSYVDGADQLAGGVGDYVDGVNDYVDGVGGYVDGVSQYAGGAQDYVDGVDTYVGGVNQYVKGVGTAATQSAKAVTKQAPQMCQQFDIPDAACPAFVAGVEAGAQGTAQGVKQSMVKSGDPSEPSAGEELKAGGKELKAGGRQVSKGGTKIISGGKKLTKGDDQLVAGGKELKAGATKLDKADKKLSSGGKKLTKSSTKIKKGAEKLSGAGSRLSSGGEQLATGATGIHSGAKQLATGISDLHDGTGDLHDGTGKLADGAKQLKTGAQKLADGTGKLATAGGKLSTGVEQSATGTKSLSDGLSKLNTGGEDLADGADELATGLEDGAKEMPTYSKHDRTQLAEVASAPVSNEQPDQLFAGETTATLLMALALWIGGLITYLIISAVPSSAFGSSKSSGRLALDSLLPGVLIGAGQAVLLSIMLTALLDLSAGRFVGLLGFGLLAAATFAVLNHALAAWFGGIGRFVSMVVAVLTAAGALTYALPELFSAVRPFLPTTPALDGVRAIVTDAPSPGAQIGTLLAWLVIGVAASAIAVTRKRMATAMSLAA